MKEGFKIKISHANVYIGMLRHWFVFYNFVRTNGKSGFGAKTQRQEYVIGYISKVEDKFWICFALTSQAATSFFMFLGPIL